MGCVCDDSLRGLRHCVCCGAGTFCTKEREGRVSKEKTDFDAIVEILERGKVWFRTSNYGATISIDGSDLHFDALGNLTSVIATEW